MQNFVFCLTGTYFNTLIIFAAKYIFLVNLVINSKLKKIKKKNLIIQEHCTCIQAAMY